PCTQCFLFSAHTCNICVELGNVYLLAGIFLLHVSVHGQRVILGGNIIVRDKRCLVFYCFMVEVEVQDCLLVVFVERVLCAILHKVCGCVHKQHIVSLTVLLEHQDNRRNSSTKEQIRWQLDNGVYKVVVNQILADRLFSTASVQNTWELNDCCYTVFFQVVQHVHGKGQVRVAFRG